MNDTYLFCSERLGFRNWELKDYDVFADMNASVNVMEHFPTTLTSYETKKSVQRFKHHFQERGYTYFATDILKSNAFIGFIGLYFQEYVTEFTPATDIGWRLKESAWGKGYATEGAKRCLLHAFEDLKLEQVISVCTINNKKSEKVMQKIGMNGMGTFKHPKLAAFPEYEECACYVIKKEQ